MWLPSEMHIRSRAIACSGDGAAGASVRVAPSSSTLNKGFCGAMSKT
jgi:hypothetical protein